MKRSTQKTTTSLEATKRRSLRSMTATLEAKETNRYTLYAIITANSKF